MSSLEDLIPLVNRLQDLVFNTIGSDTVDLPQVVVVGSQSCGKSSVLENIVGRDFLPRGTGIVTRRPLILQLINVRAASDDNTTTTDPAPAPAPASSDYNGDTENNIQNNQSTLDFNGRQDETHDSPDLEEWAEFLHMPGKRFTDFSLVRREIENETARIAGINKGISRQPISLKVFSPHVLNLTLVDLPGLTKIPIGDQPTDIEKQIRSLILEYIAKPNSLILAVSPANVDLVNSESLKLARSVDPQGKRTVGVLTKLDLMDQGTNALDILSGRVYPLKLGFIGVVNRSQQDIQAHMDLRDALKHEEEFFKSHPVYKNISFRCGTRFLTKTLNQTLMNHIRERLPDIKAKLNTLMGQTQQELSSYGDPMFSGPEHRGTLILQLMTRFATSFISSIDGTSSDISTKELCGGARIYYIYNDVFGRALSMIDPTLNLSTSDIRTAIRNSTGPRPSLFVPELAFDLLVKPQIKLLEPPSQRCVEMVYEELMKICHNCGSAEIARYPKLQAKLIEVISDLLRERLGPTSNYVESLIAIQRAYINTNHPNFLGAAAAMSSVLNEKQEKEKRLRHAFRIQERQQRTNESLSEADASSGEQSTETLKTGKHRHSTSSVTNSNAESGNNVSQMFENRHLKSDTNSNQPAKESFLNYFFGKDGTAHQGQSPDSHRRHREQDLQAHGKSVDANSGESEEDAEFVAQFSNTSLKSAETMKNADGITDEEQYSERELLETELIRRLISSYFDIVREAIQDQVPKAVMHLLVNFSKESVQNRLTSELYKESLFDDLLREDDALAQERKKCEKLLKTYKDAARMINEVI